MIPPGSQHSHPCGQEHIIWLQGVPPWALSPSFLTSFLTTVWYFVLPAGMIGVPFSIETYNDLAFKYYSDWNSPHLVAADIFCRQWVCAFMSVWRFSLDSTSLLLCCYALACKESMAGMLSGKVLLFPLLAKLNKNSWWLTARKPLFCLARVGKGC